MKDLVFKGQNGQALTNSLLVAEKFGKEHSDVLKAIDSLASKMAENQCKGYFADTSVVVQSLKAEINELYKAGEIIKHKTLNGVAFSLKE